MKLEKVKKNKGKVPSGKSLLKKIMAVLVSVAVFCGSYYFIYTTSEAARDTVTVLRVKAKEGLPAQAVITADNIERYQIIRKEYTDKMVPAERIEEVLEKFTTHYLRNGAILHFDEVSAEKLKKNEWLYEEALRDKEILTIPYNYLESGGDILTPGDRVRIRVKYEIDEAEYEQSYDFSDEYYSRPVRQGKADQMEHYELLFDSIVVTDMLNSKSRSIYEVYREVLRYPESARQRILKSKDFMDSIVPKALVLAATPEQVEKYMQYKSRSIAILITILPRDENTIILDQGQAREAEVSVWLERQR